MDVTEYSIREAMFFANDNVKTITYYPIYMAMFLQDDPVEFVDISLDRFKL